MNVRQLIQCLQQLDQEADVLIVAKHNGYSWVGIFERESDGVIAFVPEASRALATRQGFKSLRERGYPFILREDQ